MKKASFGIVIQENAILLTKRLDVPVWVLPGGGIDEGETPEEACIREIKEETGLEAEIIRKTQQLSPVNSFTQPTSLFLCTAHGELLRSSNESSHNKFFPLTDLPEDLFWPHKLWIEEAISSRHTIHRELDEISWLNVIIYTLKHPWQVLRFMYTLATR